VLEDLGPLRYLDPVLLSEEQGIEKPAGGIWVRALKMAGMVSPHETLHVGDGLKEWVHMFIWISYG
jgi:FMN phosphatase YigB (HAD superfamily)